MNPARAALLALVLVLGAAPGAARELFSHGEFSLDFSGSLRELFTVTDGTDGPKFSNDVATDPGCFTAATFPQCSAFARVGERDVWTSLTRLRLRFDAEAPWGLSATAIWDNEFFAGILDTLEFGLLGRIDDDTFLGAEDDVHVFGLQNHKDRRFWHTRLYRGFVKWESERFEVSVGRQRIPWGVGRLWNPIDRFNFVPPLALEPDLIPGIDSIDARWVFSGFTYLQAVYAPATSREDSLYALRLHGTMEDMDYSIMAGVFEQARAVGMDLTGNLGGAAFGIEAVWTDPERPVWKVQRPSAREPDDYWQIVVSLDGNIPVGSGLYALIEHLYNGNALGFGEGRAGSLLPFFEATEVPPKGFPTAAASGLPGPYVRSASAAIFAGSRVLTTARHQTGFQLGYDLLPELRAELIVLYDWNGNSTAFYPVVSFTGSDVLELRVGGQLFTGDRTSQYGRGEPLFLVIAEWFF